ncbi:MAG: hypothetical protein ACR2O3_14195 [Rhizobiaceae bacterium]
MSRERLEAGMEKDGTLVPIVRWSIIVGLVFSLVCSISIMDWGIFSEPGGILLLGGSLIVFAFIFAPYGLLYACHRTLAASSGSQIVLLMASILTTLAYAYIFWTVFFFNDNPDAQDGIVLVIFPVYLLVIDGAFCVGAFVARAIANRKSAG